MLVVQVGPRPSYIRMTGAARCHTARAERASNRVLTLVGGRLEDERAYYTVGPRRRATRWRFCTRAQVLRPLGAC